MERSAQIMDLSPVDAGRFRIAMGAFATGVAVVTTAWRGEMFGMTVNSLTSVSLDPCLLLICPRRGSATGAAIRERGAFAVNLLSRNQQDLAHRFVGAFAGRFDGLRPRSCGDGLPLLPGCLAYLRCRVRDIHPGGDHDIVVAEAESCSMPPRDEPPLIFYRGAFGAFAPDAGTNRKAGPNREERQP